MESDKHKVVVVGGSFGGVNAAYQLRRKLGDRIDVTVISAEADFTFIPSLPWVMMGWRKPDAIKVAMAGPLGRKAVARFLAADGGRAIIGANPGASCSGPAYEVIMMLETALRRQKRRHLFDLHLVTPEPFLGHFGVNGIGNMSRMMEDKFHSRHLNWTTTVSY